MLYFEREREPAWAGERQRERGTEGSPRRLHAVGAGPDAGLRGTNPEILTGDETKSRPLDRLSPPPPRAEGPSLLTPGSVPICSVQGLTADPQDPDRLPSPGAGVWGVRKAEFPATAHIRVSPAGFLYPRGLEVIIAKCAPRALAASRREESLTRVFHSLPSENTKLPPEVQLRVQSVPPETQQVCG